MIISDVHANLEALEAVLADVATRPHDRIICLGDVIGYGPDPCSCIDLVEQNCAFSLLGNHDFACLYEPTNFNPIAVQGSYWTRAQFEPGGEGDRDEAAARRQAFLHLMRTYAYLDDDRDYLLVHASPRKPLSEYLFQDDVQKPSKIAAAFGAMRGSYAFVGHTHVPGVFTAEQDEGGDGTEVSVGTGLTNIVILDYEEPAFVSIEAEIMYPEEDSIVQIECFGVPI